MAEPRADHAADIAEIKRLCSGDETSAIPEVKRRYPGDTVAEAIMQQSGKPLELRLGELEEWLNIGSRARPRE